MPLRATQRREYSVQQRSGFPERFAHFGLGINMTQTNILEHAAVQARQLPALNAAAMPDLQHLQTVIEIGCQALAQDRNDLAMTERGVGFVAVIGCAGHNVHLKNTNL